MIRKFDEPAAAPVLCITVVVTVIRLARKGN